MKHQRHAHRLEAAPRKFGTLRGGRRRKRRADHVRKADAAALEQVAILDDARESAATERGAGRLFPGVGEEGLAVEPFEGADDALLQPEQVLAHRLRIDELGCRLH